VGGGSWGGGVCAREGGVFVGGLTAICTKVTSTMRFENTRSKRIHWRFYSIQASHIFLEIEEAVG